MGNNVISNSDDKDEEYIEKTSISTIILILILIIFIELAVGILGYRIFNRNTWLDSFRNSSQVLTSVTEAVIANNDLGKIWSSIYSLVTFFIAIVLIGVIAGKIASETT